MSPDYILALEELTQPVDKIIPRWCAQIAQIFYSAITVVVLELTLFEVELVHLKILIMNSGAYILQL